MWAFYVSQASRKDKRAYRIKRSWYWTKPSLNNRKSPFLRPSTRGRNSTSWYFSSTTWQTAVSVHFFPIRIESQHLFTYKRQSAIALEATWLARDIAKYVSCWQWHSCDSEQGHTLNSLRLLRTDLQTCWVFPRSSDMSPYRPLCCFSSATDDFQ